MRVLMPVSPHGQVGAVQDHIEEIVVRGRANGLAMTVATQRSQFTNRLRSMGIPVLEVDLEDLPATNAAADLAGPWDIVHSYPFSARRFALQYASRRGLPLVVTFHNHDLDEINDWRGSTSAIIALNGAIADGLRRAGVPSEQLNVIESGLKPSEMARRVPSGSDLPLLLSVVNWSDAEYPTTKRLILEFIARAADVRSNNWHIEIAGDLLARPTLVADIGLAALRDYAPTVSFQSTTNHADRRALHERSFATIGPGYWAISALAAGIPSILTHETGSYALAPVGRAAALLHGTIGERVSGADFFDYCTLLASDAEKRRDFAEYASRTVQYSLDPRILEMRMLSVYHSILTPQHSAHITSATARPDPQTSDVSATAPVSNPFTIDCSEAGIRILYSGARHGHDYAFYIFTGMEKTRERAWGPESTLELTREEVANATAVQCFVRDAAQNRKGFFMRLEDHA